MDTPASGFLRNPVQKSRRIHISRACSEIPRSVPDMSLLMNMSGSVSQLASRPSQLIQGKSEGKTMEVFRKCVRGTVVDRRQ